MITTQELIDLIIEGIQEKKGHRVSIADLSDIPSAPAEAFVICTGNNPAQVDSIVDSIENATRVKGRSIPPPLPVAKTPYGWPWITGMSWSTFSFPTCGSITTSTTCGLTPRSPRFRTSTDPLSLRGSTFLRLYRFHNHNICSTHSNHTLLPKTTRTKTVRRCHGSI